MSNIIDMAGWQSRMIGDAARSCLTDLLIRGPRLHVDIRHREGCVELQRRRLVDVDSADGRVFLTSLGARAAISCVPHSLTQGEINAVLEEVQKRANAACNDGRTVSVDNQGSVA